MVLGFTRVLGAGPIYTLAVEAVLLIGLSQGGFYVFFYLLKKKSVAFLPQTADRWMLRAVG